MTLSATVGPRRWRRDAKRVASFSLHVLRRFYHHRGLLLSGAIAYNLLLSAIPLGGLLLVTLSHLIEPESLTRVISTELEHLLPGASAWLADEIGELWNRREFFGKLSLLMLLFFGSVAFRVLGEAMAAIFADVRRVASKVRGFWSSLAIPFLYVGCVAAGLVLLTLLTSVMERYADRQWSLVGLTVSLDAAQRWTLLAGALVGELLLFTSVYMVLPGVPVRPAHAAVAGVVATSLWEITRRLLLWYFANVSTIGVFYGSLTTVVITLLSAEVAAITLLLGAQVVAELTYARDRGIAWYAVGSPPERAAGERAAPRRNGPPGS